MKDKKIFFFDIDGTLAIKGIIPQSTIDSLSILKDKGYYIFICTGRPYHYAFKHYQKYADGFIASNGRYIVYNGQVILDRPLDSKQIQYFMNIMRKYNCGFGFIDQDKGFLEIHDEAMADEMINSYYPGYYQIDFSDSDVTAYMFDIYFSNHSNFKCVQSELENQVILNEHYPHHSADATILGVDKGDGIDCVLNHFNIDIHNSFAFGDGANDICMFKHVGHGIAMGNAIDELKNIAEYTTTSIDDEGIYNALVYYKVFD